MPAWIMLVVGCLFLLGGVSILRDWRTARYMNPRQRGPGSGAETTRPTATRKAADAYRPRTLRVPINHPCWSCGMLVLVECAAE
jgi:hypothetical protein